jgi:hypothetical protein
VHLGLPLPWVRHLKDQSSKDKLEQAIRGSVTALSRLYDLLGEKIEVSINQETKVEDFDSSSWAYKQAYRNGYRAALKETKELLSFIKDKG